ncbi:cupin domain-containing protein [Streptomyces sp. ME03-5709C]|nr:cupin domain-containing protein [Streptomyces sp. ME03-5709C]
METKPAPGVLAQVADLIGRTPVGQRGALWRLGADRRQLDANVIRLPAGAEVRPHVEADLDVLLYVVDGGGHLSGSEGERQTTLAPGALAWLPRGTRRALFAGAAGLTYLTVHARRPGLTIAAPAGRAPAPEAGEAACLLHRVCPECGRLAGESDALYCSRCGSGLPLR